MYLKIRTHAGLKPETLAAIRTELPCYLQVVVKKYFSLDLRHPAELQVIEPEIGYTVGAGKFVDWSFNDVFDDGGRDYVAALDAINKFFIKIFIKHELASDEDFGLRGSIPHVSSFTNSAEDLVPIVVRKK